MRYMELEGDYERVKKQRDEAATKFNTEKAAKDIRDAKATREQAVTDRATAITDRETAIGTKGDEVAAAKSAAGGGWESDATYIAKKGELDVLEAAQKQDKQLNLEQEAADALADQTAQKAAFDTLDTDITTLDGVMQTQETELAMYKEMMDNA